MLVRDRLYDELARIDPECRFEVHQGRLREKPSMSYRHGRVSFLLGLQLGQQLDLTQFDVRVNHGRVRRPGITYYIPDVMVVPVEILGPDIDRPDVLETYDAPLPFLAEVWSPSTGSYDVDEKLPEYMNRGDAEIWRLHPFDHTVTAYRRQPDGSYTVTVFHGGIVELHALPGVKIDIDALFAQPQDRARVFACPRMSLSALGGFHLRR
jgi:Uma2 family endonuclease